MKFQTNNRKGFTLVEILVVIALTVIVLGLIFGPLMQSLGFVKQTETAIRAQDNARQALSAISRDLADAMFVYDNTRFPIYFPMLDEDGNEWLDGSGNPTQVYYAKLDMILPRMKGYCTAPDATHDPADEGRTREFERGNEASPTCPYDQSPLDLRPVQPLAADTKVVRYFVGLEDPSAPYVNPYAPFKHNPVVVDGGTPYEKRVTKNLYVVYRVVFSPYDEKTTVDGNPVTRNRLFPTGRGATENVSDPNFFYNKNENGFTTKLADGTEVNERYCDAWKKVCRLIVNPQNTDLVTVEYDKNDGHPIIMPTVQFSPTAVHNDPLIPATDEYNDPEHRELTPTRYKATYGHWVLPYEVVLTRDNGSTSYYTSAMPDGNMWILKDQPDPQADTQVFNITNYEITSTGPDPGDASWRGYEYGLGKFDPVRPELAFTVDTAKGIVNFAFPHVDTGTSDALAGAFGGKIPVSLQIDTDDINAYYQNTPDQAKYRIWEFHHPLSRTLPYQVANSETLTILADQFLANSSVAQGLERLIGPNCNPGDSYGKPIQYNRVPFWNMFAEPGLNQYKVDVEYPVLDGAGSIIANMDGTAAVYFHSDQNETAAGVKLPEASDYAALGITGLDKVYLLYYEQNNKRGDTLRASYVTRSLLTVTVGIRVYDSGNGKPQVMQLTNKIKLRNSAI